MEVIKDKDAKKLAGVALGEYFKQAKSKPVLFLSSGGSALGILDELDESVFNKNFTIGVLDERFNFDPAINNFLQLKRKLNDVTGANWIDSVPKEGDTLETLASLMENAWRAWREQNPDGKIIATIGMGVDGHTAGIMPHSKSLTSDAEDFRWVRGYDSGSASRFPLRITATFEFLRNQIDETIIYISGEEKRPALERVLATHGSLSETPARIFREMKNVRIFIDL